MGFRLVNVNGRAALVDGEDYYDVETVSSGELPSDPMAVLSHGAGLAAIELGTFAATGKLGDVVLGPPVPRPSKVFGIGLNYKKHAEESGLDLPETPVVFTKFPSCIVGPKADVVLRGERVDWEAELVVVIGQGGRDISEADAWSHVAGLTAGQDISDRRVQFATQPPQFNLGKSYDTYGPIGPALVSADLFPDPNDLRLTCDVAGDRKQDGRTSDMVFSVAELIGYLSAITTLETGDLIFTGTPEGVGSASGQYLIDGDVIVTAIEGVGALRNRCVLPGGQA